MDGTAGVTAPIIIGQDEGTELRVQAIVQSGRQQLDIRIWRRGPAGFAPSTSALTLEPEDVVALREGIAELLEASNGGQAVARVVWDKDEGRRLRAETEPFGTRFLARLSFWQRVRDTWRPASDGLVLAAETLQPLRAVINRLLPVLQGSAEVPAPEAEVSLRPSFQRWPTPGADWLTVEPRRLTFHPRGIRMTAAVEEQEEEHRLVLRQWRREESLWLPEDDELALPLLAVDALLAQLQLLAEQRPEEWASEEISGGHWTVRLAWRIDGDTRILTVEACDPATQGATFVPMLSLPVEYLPRFGRMLAQAGMLLITLLSEKEQRELQEREGNEIAPAITGDALLPEPEPVPEQPNAPPSTASESTSSVTAIDPESKPGEVTPPEPTRRLTPVGEVQLGRHFIFLYLQEDSDRRLALQWDGYSFLIPLEEVTDMLNDLRGLYYDALRGRRKQVLTVEGDASIGMSIHNQGSSASVVLTQSMEERETRLVFPVSEVPAFLNAAANAVKRIARDEASATAQ